MKYNYFPNPLKETLMCYRTSKHFFQLGVTNVVTLIILLSVPCVALLCGHIVSRVYGTWGWGTGCVSGLVLTISFWYSLSVWRAKNTPYSFPCRRGRCRMRADFHEEFKDGVIHVTCRCGDLYRINGDDFEEILPNGDIQPYMRLERIGSSRQRKWKQIDPISKQKKSDKGDTSEGQGTN
jgi:hypothetical protein